ncbi:hypothetical protein AAMO2058_001446700 [Amorphochlora amoebiformis]
MRFTLPGFIDMPFETPRKIRSAIKELQEYGARVVKNHRTKMKEGKIDPNAKGTLLSALCEKAEDGSEFSDTLVLENVYSFMFAGLDTSSTALAHAMIHLARHPAVQEKARKEALAHKEVDFEIVMNGLPYLACVAREALRLCPPINGIGGNREIKEGITFNGKRIAKDTGIGACQLAHHRNPKIWGKDAEVFRPDRHMKEDGKAVPIFDNEGMKFLSFGGGVRSCIGKNLASMELKYMLWAFLRRFRVDSAKGYEFGRYWHSSVIMCKPDNGVKVSVNLL